ncbi:MAG: tRNA pseudouridine(55) synthase TruB [Thermodesulfobacteria bacterium]|nr:tRNA pseudouridine(55) synthase TruB [Thermodesulfobacteriota bacterium]
MKSGVLILDKPKGMTSFKVVECVKRRLRVKKAGHTGTLDPMATGLLVVCIGSATKIARFLTDADKVYQGRITLGIETDTYDMDGEILARSPVPESLTREDVQAAADGFKGPILQVPPAYSAAKHNGVPLYKLARKGVTVKKEPKTVHIYDFQITSYEPPHFDFLVHCSKGTYVRTLAHEMGKALGCGAVLSGLRRLRSGYLSVEEAISVQSIMDREPKEIRQRIMPVELVLSHIPSIVVNNRDALFIQQGRGLGLIKVVDYLQEQMAEFKSIKADYLRVMTIEPGGKERLVAIAKWPDFNDHKGRLEILRVWNPN